MVMNLICVIYVILQKLGFPKKGTHGNACVIYVILQKLSFPIKGAHGNACNMCNICNIAKIEFPDKRNSW